MLDVVHELNTLAEQHLLRKRRTVTSPQSPNIVADEQSLISFASNDYLGLANDERLKRAFVEGIERYGVGAGASHLVSGHMQPHAQFDAEAAAFVGARAGLLFSSGYAANLGILMALADRESIVFADKLNHACLNDGALLARAELKRFAHGDLNRLERLLQTAHTQTPKQNRVIAVDAVFSMDGDIADLPRLLRLANEFDAWLVVDDAHGFGVLGQNGRGTLSHFNISLNDHPRLVMMATLGKAAGIAGAFVAAHQPVIDWLVNKARTYVFATAMPPAQAHALCESLRVIEQADAQRTHLFELIGRVQQWGERLPSSQGQMLKSQTAIQPLVLGESAHTSQCADQLRERGIWVPAIRPPTVPKGAARLRISLSAAHTDEQVEKLLHGMDGVLGRQSVHL